jgi:hypothetical protein
MRRGEGNGDFKFQILDFRDGEERSNWSRQSALEHGCCWRWRSSEGAASGAPTTEISHRGGRVDCFAIAERLTGAPTTATSFTAGAMRSAGAFALLELQAGDLDCGVLLIPFCWDVIQGYLEIAAGAAGDWLRVWA